MTGGFNVTVKGAALLAVYHGTQWPRKEARHALTLCSVV